MLAMPHSHLGATAEEALEVAKGSLFEVKWDGVRCLAHVHDGGVILRNRRHVDITDRYPDVARALVEALPEGTHTFDGEIVAFGEDGLPSFDLLARRDRLTKPEKIRATMAKIPACFILFDVLMDRGQDLRPVPLIGRRVVLDDISTTLDTSPHLRIGPATYDGPTIWKFVSDRKMEGLIAKAIDAPYTAGRSGAWVKLKLSSTSSLIVTGYEEGSGRAEGMVGALYLSDSAGVQRGKVGTGFSQQDRKDLKAALDNMRPEDEPMIVEVEYASVTKDGALRFPSFKGVRQDQTPADCKLEGA